jgi:hypothetical protein
MEAILGKMNFFNEGLGPLQWEILTKMQKLGEVI